MAGKRVSVTYKVVDEFSDAQRKYTQGVKQASDATKDFQRTAGGTGGSSFWRQGAQDLFYMAGAATQVYNSFSQVFSIANQWADMGIAAERNKIALQSLTGAGEEYESQVRSIIDATKGMVTEGEAAGYAYRLQRFGLAETADEMERFMRTVSIVSAINPQLGGTAEAINQIQLTLSNMSFMRLDQLGVSAGQVRARMEELKKETKGLSNEAAFQTAVMEQLEMQADAVGDSILGMNDAQTRMETRWRGFKEWAGLEIAQGFEAIAESAEGAAIAIDKVGWKKFAGEAFKQIGITSKEVYESDAGQSIRDGIGDAITMGFVTGLANELLGGGNNDITGRRGTTVLAPQESPYFTPSAYDMGFFQPGMNEPFSTPYVGPVQGGDYSAYYARQQQRDAYEMGRPQTGFDTTFAGAIRKGSTEFGDFAGQAQEVIGLLPLMQTGFTNIAGAIGDGQSSLGQMVSDADVLANMTLDEFWGIGASNFDTSVYSEMTTALTDAGVSADVAAAAIQAYELNTGMANASSTVFADQLAELTLELQNGELSAAEYAMAVSEISRQDFSWADKVAQSMAESGNLDGAIAYIEALKSMSSEDWQAFNTLGESMTGAVGTIQNALFGGGEEGAEVVPGLSAAQIDADLLKEKVSLLALEGGSAISTFADTATNDFGRMSDSAVISLDRIRNNAIGLNGLRFSVFMDVIPSLMGGTTPTPGAAPAVPGGGSPNVAPNIVTGTGTGAPQTINTTVTLDKQVVAQAVNEVTRTRGG